MRIKKCSIATIIVGLWICSLSGCQSKQRMLSQEDLAKWGEDKVGLNTNQTTNYPLLNVVTDNPTIGNEFDFVRIAPWQDDSTMRFSDFQSESLTIEAGESYCVMVYYHNAADVQLGEAGAATCPVLVVAYPELMKKGEENHLSGTFAYGVGVPPSMTVDWQTLVAADDVRLQPGIVLEGTEPEYCAMLCDNDGENWSVQNPSTDTQDGVSAQAFFFDDIAPGYDGAGYVLLKLDAVALE